MCVLLHFLGQISEKNDSNLKYLPPTQTLFGKLSLPEYRQATLELLMKKKNGACSSGWEKQVSPHEEVRIVEKGSASGGHKSGRSVWPGTVGKNTLGKVAFPLGPEH